MPGASIEAPYSFASLPIPLDSKYGQTYVSPVYGFRAGKKRRRHEIVAGVDGETVNIYNVQNQSLVTSYALSPQTYLCHRPCSAHVRVDSQSVPRRQTYIVAKDGPNAARRRLICIHESAKPSNRDHGLGIERPVIKEVELPIVGEVASMEAIPSNSRHANAALVAVFFKNGDVWAWDGDQGATWYERDPDVGHVPGFEIEYATLLDVASSKKGILRQRGDVLAVLDSVLSEKSGSSWPLMCHLVRIAGCRQLRLYLLPTNDESQIQSRKLDMQHLLMAYDLPARRKHSPNTAQYELNGSSGTLLQLLDGEVTVFDLTAAIPKVLTSLGSDGSPISSFTRISASSVVAVSKQTATVYETTFGSAQTSVPVQAYGRITTSSVSTKKRKREDEQQLQPFCVISAFSDLSTVLGISGNEIKALQLNNALQQSKRRKSTGVLLAEVLSNGSAGVLFNAHKHEQSPKHWQKWKTKVDQFVDTADFKSLEDLVASDHWLTHLHVDDQPDNPNGPNGFPNGDSTRQGNRQHLEESCYPTGMQLQKIGYLLRKAFAPVDGDTNRLEVRIRSTKIIKWLARTGYLSGTHLQKVIPEKSLGPGVTVDALAAFDNTLDLMKDLIASHSYWDAAEIVQALKIVLRSLSQAPDGDMSLPLLAPFQVNGVADEPNEDAEKQLFLETEGPHSQVNGQSGHFERSLQARIDTVHLILGRLHTFSSSTVTSSLRATLSYEELLSLITVLRIQLASGGLTSRYIEFGGDHLQNDAMNGFDADGKHQQNHQSIETIGGLLNCVTDAVGTSGWLVGLSGQASQIQHMVECLRDEISAGLEGCYEAATLMTFLNDAERYAASLERSEDSTAMHKLNSDYAHDDQKALLPLSIMLDPPALQPRDNKGAKKSSRVLAQEKSRAVGKYSIDRVRL